MMLEPSPDDPRRFMPKITFDGTAIQIEAICLIDWDITLLLAGVQAFKDHLPEGEGTVTALPVAMTLRAYTSRNPNFTFLCEVDQRSSFDRAVKVTVTGKLLTKTDCDDLFNDAWFFQKFLPKDLDDTTRMPYDS
ncbi:MAG: hypothetical protein V2I53_02000 [Paracoccaceae bacterium]|jgi:hypothetical protein|nr:hypothetical protein [Paracoccaceae bacterium]